MWKKYLLLFMLPAISFGYIGMQFKNLPYVDSLKLFFLFPKVLQEYRYSTINVVLIACLLLVIILSVILFLEQFSLVFNELGSLHMIRYGSMKSFMLHIQKSTIRSSIQIAIDLYVSILFWTWCFIGSFPSASDAVLLLLIIVRLVYFLLVFVELIVIIQYKCKINFISYYLLIGLSTIALIECMGDFNLIIHFPQSMIGNGIQIGILIVVLVISSIITLKFRGEQND